MFQDIDPDVLEAVNLVENEYQEFFKKKLEEYGIKSPSELDYDEAQEFFNDIKKNWHGTNESVEVDEDTNDNKDIVDLLTAQVGARIYDEKYGLNGIVVKKTHAGNNTYLHVEFAGKTVKIDPMKALQTQGSRYKVLDEGVEDVYASLYQHLVNPSTLGVGDVVSFPYSGYNTEFKIELIVNPKCFGQSTVYHLKALNGPCEGEELAFEEDYVLESLKESNEESLEEDDNLDRVVEALENNEDFESNIEEDEEIQVNESRYNEDAHKELVKLIKDNSLYFFGRDQKVSDVEAEIKADKYIDSYSKGKSFSWKKTPTNGIGETADELAAIYLGYVNESDDEEIEIKDNIDNDEIEINEAVDYDISKENNSKLEEILKMFLKNNAVDGEDYEIVSKGNKLILRVINKKYINNVDNLIKGE